jgi:hypothetical protein
MLYSLLTTANNDLGLPNFKRYAFGTSSQQLGFVFERKETRIIVIEREDAVS